ncbi:MAG TPA: SusD/RagB family nutrient-binding outer membrane lipoprotein, partial [Flavitalea sp.]|nr:SusD/RagB family nutrient-binding outer membrane lipoprotein [Flavitalea sp.]
LLMATGCSKRFEEYSPNPNLPTSVPPYLLLRTILGSMFDSPGDNDKATQYTLSSYTYYGDNKYWDGSADLDYEVLKNIEAMEREAVKAQGEQNPFSALAKFQKAFFYIKMSMKVGDIPMSEAMKGLENTTPKYDSQKDVFRQSLQLLEEANNDLTTLIDNNNTLLAGDFYYQERLSNPLSPVDALKAWRKVVNTFRLRVLINLSHHADDPELNVKQQFNDIISNPTKYPIMQGMEDNLQYVYNDKYNFYPNNSQNFGFDALRQTTAATWINNLAALKDLRVMKVSEPARSLGFPDTDYRSYVGASNGEDISTMGGKVETGYYSLIGRNRYYEGLTGEPTFIIGYPEMCLTIAEAINRGWVTGDANDWYMKGIKASFSFYGIVDGSNTIALQRTGAPHDYINYTVNFSFADYFNQPLVKYAGDNTTGLNQILLQKYLSMARNSGMEPYYQWRRTGVPEFATGTGVSASEEIPLRYQYPSEERATNLDNYNSALQSQYGGNDDIFAKMWIIQ